MDVELEGSRKRVQGDAQVVSRQQGSRAEEEELVQFKLGGGGRSID